MCEYFKYNTAIVREISDSLPSNALRLEPSSTPVDLGLARKQKEKYVNALSYPGIHQLTRGAMCSQIVLAVKNPILKDNPILKNMVNLVGGLSLPCSQGLRTLNFTTNLGLQIISIESDDALPDCVFVEDVVVVVGDVALLTNPGHVTRRGEVPAMKKVMEGLNVKLFEMAKINPNATLDGGDVLFTGKEFFVGISKRTNEAGCKALADTFNDFPVSPIPVKEGLHLKSFCSMANENDMLVATDWSDFGFKEIQKNAKFQYNFLKVPGNMVGANCLYIDSEVAGKTIVFPHHEVFPKSKQVYNSIEGYNKVELNMEELSKVDGALTCCSILLKL